MAKKETKTTKKTTAKKETKEESKFNFDVKKTLKKGLNVVGLIVTATIGGIIAIKINERNSDSVDSADEI